MRTVDEMISQSLARQNFNTLLLTLFAGIAVLLAAMRSWSRWFARASPVVGKSDTGSNDARAACATANYGVAAGGVRFGNSTL